MNIIKNILKKIAMFQPDKQINYISQELLNCNDNIDSVSGKNYGNFANTKITIHLNIDLALLPIDENTSSPKLKELEDTNEFVKITLVPTYRQILDDKIEYYLEDVFAERAFEISNINYKKLDNNNNNIIEHYATATVIAPFNISELTNNKTIRKIYNNEEKRYIRSEATIFNNDFNLIRLTNLLTDKDYQCLSDPIIINDKNTDRPKFKAQVRINVTHIQEANGIYNEDKILNLDSEQRKSTPATTSEVVQQQTEELLKDRFEQNRLNSGRQSEQSNQIKQIKQEEPTALQKLLKEHNKVIKRSVDDPSSNPTTTDLEKLADNPIGKNEDITYKSDLEDQSTANSHNSDFEYLELPSVEDIQGANKVSNIKKKYLYHI